MPYGLVDAVTEFIARGPKTIRYNSGKYGYALPSPELAAIPPKLDEPDAPTFDLLQAPALTLMARSRTRLDGTRLDGARLDSTPKNPT